MSIQTCSDSNLTKARPKTASIFAYKASKRAIIMRFHDEDGQREWQNPEKILAGIGLGLGSTFIDVGCGTGFFAIPAICTDREG